MMITTNKVRHGMSIKTLKIICENSKPGNITGQIIYRDVTSLECLLYYKAAMI